LHRFKDFELFSLGLNEVADSLSRDHHLSDTDLLTLLRRNIPEQVPEDFKIYPLPPSVELKITTWLCSLPPATQSPAAPQRSKIATGDTGRPTSRQSNSTMTHLWRIEGLAASKFFLSTGCTDRSRLAPTNSELCCQGSGDARLARYSLRDDFFIGLRIGVLLYIPLAY
jgi:hypothetical protein